LEAEGSRSPLRRGGFQGVSSSPSSPPPSPSTMCLFSITKSE
jgi:hypothetical protein